MEHDLTRVFVAGVPVELHRAAGAAQEALTREFAIIAAADAEEGVPRRLLQLQAELTDRYQDLSRAPLAVLEQAVEDGAEQVDLEYLVPRSAADEARRLRTLLAEADEYCRSGRLLTLTPGPELVAYRNWFLDEFVEQIEHGRPPRRWSAVAGPASASDGDGATTDSRPADEEPGAGSDEVTVSLRGAIDLESAPRIRSAVTRVRRRGASSIVLDLTAVDFVDSVGLGLLVSIHRRLHEEQGSLALANVGTNVRETLQVTGLEELFAIR